MSATMQVLFFFRRQRCCASWSRYPKKRIISTAEAMFITSQSVVCGHPLTSAARTHVFDALGNTITTRTRTFVWRHDDGLEEISSFVFAVAKWVHHLATGNLMRLRTASFFIASFSSCRPTRWSSSSGRWRSFCTEIIIGWFRHPFNINQSIL